jgi:hypothetical protein
MEWNEGGLTFVCVCVCLSVMITADGLISNPSNWRSGLYRKGQDLAMHTTPQLSELTCVSDFLSVVLAHEAPL